MSYERDEAMRQKEATEAMIQMREPRPAGSPYTLTEAAERAYGALWRCMEPNPPAELFQARKMLLAAIGKDGQRRGIAWALETFGEVQDSEMHSLIRSGNLP